MKHRTRSKIIPITSKRKRDDERGKVKHIHKWMSSSPSRGPDEPKDRTSEFENYSSSDLDVKLLLALAEEEEEVSKRMCVPDYYVDYDPSDLNTVTFTRRKPLSGGIRGGILITRIGSKTPLLHVHDDMKDMLSDCETRGKRFVVFNTGLYWEGKRGGHANAILFDTKTRTIERYDPEGRKGAIPHLREVLREEFPGWKYVGPGVEMPKGAQKFADSFTGMCVTFSLYFFLLRLSNPDETAVSVYEYILKRHEKGKLRNDILKLNKFAADKLRSLKKGMLKHVRTKSMARRRGIGKRSKWRRSAARSSYPILS